MLSSRRSLISSQKCPQHHFRCFVWRKQLLNRSLFFPQAIPLLSRFSTFCSLVYLCVLKRQLCWGSLFAGVVCVEGNWLEVVMVMVCVCVCVKKAEENSCYGRLTRMGMGTKINFTDGCAMEAKPQTHTLTFHWLLLFFYGTKSFYFYFYKYIYCLVLSSRTHRFACFGGSINKNAI